MSSTFSQIQPNEHNLNNVRYFHNNHPDSIQNNTSINLQSLVFQTSDFILIAKKFEMQTQKNQTTFEILRPNGSKFLIPIQYKNLFTQNVQGYKKSFFHINELNDCFTIYLKIMIEEKEMNESFSQSDKLQILQSLNTFMKYLNVVGVVKKKNKLAIQIVKTQLKLKKQLLKSIKNTQYQFRNHGILFLNNNSCNNVQTVQTIKQASQSSSLQNNFIKKGGYFLIQEKECQVTKIDGQIFNKKLVFKRLRKSKSKQEKYNGKLQYELNFVKVIKNNQFLVQYYVEESCTDKFYMDYVKDNLKEIIYSDYSSLSVKQTFTVAKQLIEAVHILHESGIVHRDLKLENILIQTRNGEKKLKLIDFAQSVFIGVSYSKSPNLGCTIPYSPIECLIDSEEGYNKPEIDLWSVVMIIYEIIFRRLPLFFCRSIQQQIVEGWKGEDIFSLIISHQSRRGIRKLQEYICLLTQQSLKIQQKQRLKLSVLMPFIEKLQIFYDQMNQIFLKNL